MHFECRLDTGKASVQVKPACQNKPQVIPGKPQSKQCLPWVLVCQFLCVNEFLSFSMTQQKLVSIPQTVILPSSQLFHLSFHELIHKMNK